MAEKALFPEMTSDTTAGVPIELTREETNAAAQSATRQRASDKYTSVS